MNPMSLQELIELPEDRLKVVLAEQARHYGLGRYFYDLGWSGGTLEDLADQIRLMKQERHRLGRLGQL